MEDDNELEVGTILSTKPPCKGIKNFHRIYRGKTPMYGYQIIEDSFTCMGEEICFNLLSGYELSCGYIQKVTIDKFEVSLTVEHGVFGIGIYHSDGVFDTYKFPQRFVKYQNFILHSCSLKIGTRNLGVAREKFYTLIKLAITLAKAVRAVEKVEKVEQTFVENLK